MLYVDLSARARRAQPERGRAAWPASGWPPALGYGDLISNRVVDAIGDIAGGVRLHDGTAPPTT